MMFKWLLGNKENGEYDKRVEDAQNRRKRAKKDHRSVETLINELEKERDLNHYAQVVESALGTIRGRR